MMVSKGKEKARKCPLCGRVFKSTGKLERHLDAHEGMPPEPPPNPPGGGVGAWEKL